MSTPEKHTPELISEKIETIQDVLVWLTVNFSSQEINGQVLNLKKKIYPSNKELLQTSDGKARKLRLIEEGSSTNRLRELESLLARHEYLLISFLDYLEINKGELPPSELKKMTFRPIDKLNTFYQGTSLNKARSIVEKILLEFSKKDLLIILNSEFNLSGHNKIRFTSGKLSSYYYEGIDDLLFLAFQKKNLKSLISFIRKANWPIGEVVPKKVLELVLNKFNRSRPDDFKFDD